MRLCSDSGLGFKGERGRGEEKLIMSTSSVLKPEPSCRDEPLKSHKNLEKWILSSLNPILQLSKLRLTDLAKVSRCQSQELNPDWLD